MNPMSSLKNLKVKQEQLEEVEASFRKAIERQLDEIGENAQRWGRMALIIGGTAVLAYGVVQLLTSKEDENAAQGSVDKAEVPVPQSRRAADSPVVKAIKEQIALFLSAMVKQKLYELLERLGTMEAEEVVEAQPTEV